VSLWEDVLKTLFAAATAMITAAFAAQEWR
jgi:hypothetical protein